MADLLDAPLPDFRRWLEDNGGHFSDDGSAFVDFTRRLLAMPVAELPEEQALVLLIQGLSVALVEVGNLLIARDADPHMIIAMAGRAAGTAAFCAVASLLADDSPWPRIGRMIVQDFDLAVKSAVRTQQKAAHDAAGKAH